MNLWRRLLDPSESESPSPLDKPPLIGFRYWKVQEMTWPIRVTLDQANIRTTDTFQLLSIGQGNGFPWEKGELLADCRSQTPRKKIHSSEGIDLQNCSCGFYAKTSMKEILSYSKQWNFLGTIFGAIMMYGQVEYGATTIRSEKCQLLCFITPYQRSQYFDLNDPAMTHRCLKKNSMESSGCPDFIGEMTVDHLGNDEMLCPTCKGRRLIPIGSGAIFNKNLIKSFERQQKIAKYFKLPLVFLDDHRAYCGEYGEFVDASGPFRPV